jgi:DNA invertase Pin-like site-specific DNA recombinase
MRLILDAFAEYEGLVIAKRIKVAMERKKAKGERMGHIPYGYMLDANKNLVVNPEEAKVLEAMWSCRVVDKMTFREIANQLNIAGYRNRSNKNTSGDLWTYGATARVYKNYPMLQSS